MNQSTFLLVSALSLVSVSVAAQETGVPVLKHDPFAEPVLRNMTQSSPEAANSKPVERGPWIPELTSTLRAGKNSMVIVNEKVVKLGEKIEGYKLIEVKERSAVFVKNGRKTRLSLDD